MDNNEKKITLMTDDNEPVDADALYEFVENDAEIDYLFKIFTELLDDADVGLEK